MFSPLRHHILVVILLALAGAARVVIHPPSERPGALPPVSALLAGSGWRVEASVASNWGTVYRQWTLRDTSGTSALLYVAVTSKVQTMLHWSGELGYQGEGYQVQTRGTRTLQLRSGGTARVSVVQVQRLADRRVLEYAVVRPDGIAASGTDDLLRTGWEIVQGTAGPYYLVRVSVSANARDRAGQLLGSVLPALQARIHLS